MPRKNMKEVNIKKVGSFYYINLFDTDTNEFNTTCVTKEQLELIILYGGIILKEK